jgi:hypothetical protein
VSSRGIDPPVAVAVAPTVTTLATFDTSQTQTLTVQVSNDDAVQTLACTVQRRASLLAAFADSTMPDLSSIAPLGTAAVDIDCGGNAEVRVVGYASGAGLAATVCGRDKPRSTR